VPELRRDVQIQRLIPAIQEWIRLYGRDEPFHISELWNGAGRATSIFAAIPEEKAVELCSEFAEYGLLVALPDGRFEPGPNFSRERVAALETDRLTAPSEAFDMTGKELEQGFQILLSPGLGKLDFTKTLARCRPNNQPISLVFLDIDKFKRFNTRYTESVVDRSLLPAFMRLLAAHCEFRAHASRRGGDEFLLILPNCTMSEAWSFTERFRKQVRSCPDWCGKEKWRILPEG
jgi:hypothetical protein